MRQSKVLVLERALRRLELPLAGKSVFDYGFGPGSFLRVCPKEAKLFGVELDPVVVKEVSEVLSARGHRDVDLDSIKIESWNEHRLMARKYDVFICSHVLEHLDDPIGFLSHVKRCLEHDGIFVGLVPINERVLETHHVQAISKTLVEDWVSGAEFKMIGWWEEDPWLYWFQPLFTHETGWRHRVAQGLSLSLGLAATVVGERVWYGLGRFFQTLTASKPTQAVIVLTAP